MSTQTVSDLQQLILKEFQQFKTWEDKYKRIIALGKELTPLPDEEKSEDLKVKGCQSQVWLKADLTSEGKIHFRADSDALIVRGLIAILLKVFSDQSPKDILQANVDFIHEMGLSSHLSASRANGLQSMIKQIKYYASAYDYLLKSKGLS